MIVPVFALANAGVVRSAPTRSTTRLSSPVTHGIVVGLVVGKLVGISGFTWLACRLGVASLPAGTRFAQSSGVAALGGIGFTVSLFISELAFGASRVADDAKLGILAASVTAAALGVAILLLTTRAGREPGPPKRARNSTTIVT